MKASEARQLAKQAEEATQAAENVTYNEIMMAIKSALRKDECYEIWWYKQLSNRLLSRLAADEYSVSNHSCAREGVMYKISWAEPGTNDYYNK